MTHSRNFSSTSLFGVTLARKSIKNNDLNRTFMYTKGRGGKNNSMHCKNMEGLGQDSGSSIGQADRPRVVVASG